MLSSTWQKIPPLPPLAEAYNRENFAVVRVLLEAKARCSADDIATPVRSIRGCPLLVCACHDLYVQRLWHADAHRLCAKWSST